jgi:23S rRNA (uracil1939-C5)-methyltransferase
MPNNAIPESAVLEHLELKIEKLVYGGDGLGHHDGRTVFTPLVLPGEVVSIEPLEQKKKFVRGRVVQVVTASPLRIAAKCPYFGLCGGCDYQHIPYDQQLAFKADILRETLSRLGRIRWDGPIATHASPPFAYRNRAQWKIAPDEADSPTIGYYQAGSQRLCPARECPIVSPRLEETLAALGRLLAAGKLPGDLREVEAFADHADDKLLLNLSFDQAGETTDKLAELLRAEIPGLETLLIQSRRSDRFDLHGPGYLVYRVGTHAYRVGHLSFFQVNRFLLDKLVEVVLSEARGSLALDLFAGCGLFAVPLTARFKRVIGVESNVAAARDLEANLQESGAASPSARVLSVEEFLAKWHDRPDFVVVDPPRAGVSPAALARLIKLAPVGIAYLSCDPATLARDLAVLTGTAEKPGPYLMDELHLVDIFPQTYHMEALVRLSRRP